MNGCNFFSLHFFGTEMNSKSRLLLASASIFTAVILSYFSTPIVDLIRAGFGSGNGRSLRLVIAVMSSLKRQEQRNAIRKTWKTLTSGPPESAVFFVMPEKSCPIDPFWRIRESVCSEWRVRLLPYNDENAVFKPLTVMDSNSRPSPSHDGIGLFVKFPVSVVQLGLSKKFASDFFGSSPGVDNVTVELVDVNANDVLSTANFSRQSLRSSEDGFIYAGVDEQLLPRNFEGILRISMNNLK